ncbi:MAG: glutamate mutase L [Anaerolineaceae bacterium]|nr:glutamate mutase L [Anaerolineaceae bacterium]
MTTKPMKETLSLLAIDLGTVYTRVFLFDVVEGQYSFIASGAAPNTMSKPYCDINEGLHRAFTQLEEKTGRSIIDSQAKLMFPSTGEGIGIDRLVLTYSAGPDVRMILVGLLSEVSLDSLRVVANSVYGTVVDAIGVGDPRNIDEQIDTVLRLDPQIVVFAGGTEQGASRSVLRMAEMISIILKVVPEDKRPEILYCGNAALAEKIKEGLEHWTPVAVSKNIRPSLDEEAYMDAQALLSQMVLFQKSKKIGGIEEISQICSTEPESTAMGFHRIIRYLGTESKEMRCVLGVDLGASHATMAFADRTQSIMDVFDFGLGTSMSMIARKASLEHLYQWITHDISPGAVQDYIWQKKLLPGQIPSSTAALDIEQAAARAALQMMMAHMQKRWPEEKANYDPILVSGAVFGNVAHPSDSLLMVLDGIQPVGITTVTLDTNGITGTLGTAAKIHPAIPVQVLESGAFLNLGTVICPLSNEKIGKPVVRIRYETEDGQKDDIKVMKGTVQHIPITQGKAVRIMVSGIGRTTVDPLVGKGIAAFRTIGGVCGLVIDARGRPFDLPVDLQERRELLLSWKNALKT